MLFVGIDPSLRATGVVVLEDDNPEPAVATVIKGPDTEGFSRVFDIERRVANVIYQERLRRSLGTEVRVAIEHYSFNAKFKVVALVELGTVLRLSLMKRQLRYIDPSPTQVKKFVGVKGGVKPKKEVAALWGFTTKSADIADAYVLAQIARGWAKGGAHLTKQQREVLASVRHGFNLTN